MPDLSTVESQMRADWNARAQEDAYYYVAFGRRSQADDEFDATADEVVKGLLHEWKRARVGNPRARRALEIGCGPGRLLKPMSAWFGEIHGIDVSDAMIARARERLAAIPHAHAHAGSGSDLAPFADASFDFIYSYAVFQHIPSREVVLSYLREAVRVLKPGGLVRAQLNGLPKTAKSYDTWSGVRISGDEIREFCREQGLQLLALEGLSTQYMWTTWRKPDMVDRAAPVASKVRIRRLTNAFSSEPVAPTGGRFASISAWVESLPAEADLLSLELRVGSRAGVLTYLGRPEPDGLCQLNALLPDGLPTGLVPVELWFGGKAAANSTLRVVPAPPPVPRVLAWSDGIDLMSEAVHTGSVKLQIEEFARPEEIRAYVGGQEVRNLETFCTDPMPPRHEVNFDLPEGVKPGVYPLEVRYGARRLPALPLAVQGD
ncbi:MAG: class I SAM-dependent methyltransferase [Bryobacteraceae bacterium]|nr:class I SAM-dependent methyltransferase [Bryobacteraceae bacterium]